MGDRFKIGMFGWMAAVFFILAATGQAQPVQSTFGPMAGKATGAQTPPLPAALRLFLIKDLSASVEDNMKATTYVRWAQVGRDIVVYISGGGPSDLGEMGGWCGSGGCQIDILTPSGASYRKIGDIQGWAPIRRLDTRSHGRPDLGIWVQGGGVYPGYLSRIRFDGRHYPIKGWQLEGNKVPGASGRPLLRGDERPVRLYE